MSQIVVQESSGGDPDAAARRLEMLKDITLLEVTEDLTTFAQELIAQLPLPDKAAVDAIHIALSIT